MPRFKTCSKIIEKIKNRLTSRDFMESNRVSNTDFTRRRKLPFFSLVCFMINSIKQTLQKELTQFMKLTSSLNISKSAFCQQRIKLKPEAFVELNNVLVQEFYTDNAVQDWNGFRLLSIDSSTLELPKSQELMGYFGCHSQEDKVPMARISTYYDLLNNTIIDGEIATYKTDEYSLALKHMGKAKKDDLIIFDRGFGAIWFFYYMVIRGINFVVRLQQNFISEVDLFWVSDEDSKIIEINSLHRKSLKRLEEKGIIFKPFKLRLVKVILDNGDVEVLAASLFDEEKFPTDIFKKLYFKRWGIEVSYDHLKNHIEVGNFTGYSTLVVKQDFYSSIFIANLQAIIIRDAQREMEMNKNETKYEYKINRNLSLGYMKDRIIKIMTSNNPRYIEELKKLFQIEPIPVRKDRTFPRKEERKRKKYFMNKKEAI